MDADDEAVHVFKTRVVNGACLTMAINGWNFLVQVYYIPSFYQLVYGYSAVKSAALLLPITLMQSEFCPSASSRLILIPASGDKHPVWFGRTLDRSLPGVYPLRLGLLGSRSWPLLHAR